VVSCEGLHLLLVDHPTPDNVRRLLSTIKGVPRLRSSLVGVEPGPGRAGADDRHAASGDGRERGLRGSERYPWGYLAAIHEAFRAAIR
jgi:hypothetical protein